VIPWRILRPLENPGRIAPGALECRAVAYGDPSSAPSIDPFSSSLTKRLLSARGHARSTAQPPRRQPSVLTFPRLSRRNYSCRPQVDRDTWTRPSTIRLDSHASDRQKDNARKSSGERRSLLSTRRQPAFARDAHDGALLMGERDLALLVEACFFEVVDESARVSHRSRISLLVQHLITQKVGKGGTNFSLSTLGSRLTLSVLASASQQ
jgi:hypothetical protein